MKMLKSVYVIILIAAISVFYLPLQSFGAQAGGFSVTPILPENQVPSVNGYFNLMVQPGQEQDLFIRISNKTEEEMTVAVSTVTASTNENGIVNYTSEGLMDETLSYGLSDLTEVTQEKITIPPNVSVETVIRLKVPNTPFEGSILGSIQVTRELTAEEMDTDNMIVNQYNYVVGVMLTENSEMPTPDFDLGEVGPTLSNYRASVVHNIRNIRPILVKEVNVSAQIISQKSGDIVFEKTNSNAEFAPNSIYPFILEDSDGKGLQPGNYLSKVRLEYQGEVWEFEQEFVIETDEAANINENALYQDSTQTASAGNVALWAVILFCVIIVLLITLLVTLIVIIRQRKA